jgi:hypothetical protein
MGAAGRGTVRAMDESRPAARRTEAVADWFGLRGEERRDEQRRFEWWMLTTPLLFGIAASDAYGTTTAVVVIAALMALPAIAEGHRVITRRPRHRRLESAVHAGTLIGLVAMVARWIESSTTFGTGLLLGVGTLSVIVAIGAVVHVARRGAASSRAGR